MATLLCPLLGAEETPELRFGPFILKPVLRVDETFESNITHTHADTMSDFITTSEAGLQIRLQPETHRFALDLLRRNINYAKHGEYTGDEQAVKFSGDLRFPVAQLTFDVAKLKLFEPTGTVITDKVQRTFEPMNVELVVPTGRFKLDVGVHYERLRYDLPAYQRLDYDETRTFERLIYDISTENSVYLQAWQGRVIRTEGLLNDNHYSDFSIGLRTSLTDKLTQDIRVGILTVDYEDTSPYKQLDSHVSEVSYRWELKWKPTDVTTWRLFVEGAPDFSETDEFLFRRTVAVAVSHTFTTRLKGEFGLTVTNNNIVGRAETYHINPSVGVTYAIGSHMDVYWRYNLVFKRGGESSADTYNDEIASLGFVLHF